MATYRLYCAVMPSGPTRSPKELWDLFAAVSYELRRAIEPTVRREIGVSAAEATVLEGLNRLGLRGVRQSALAALLGWHKSRLSHQLSRMQRQGYLVRRTLSPAAAELSLRPTGIRALAQSRATRARAIREHFMGALTVRNQRVLRRLLLRIVEHQSRSQ